MVRLPLVKLLTRPGCIPCDQAKFVLKKLKTRVDFEAKVVNILKEPEYKRFNDEVPVILVDEEPICKTKIVEAHIYEAIQKAHHHSQQ